MRKLPPDSEVYRLRKSGMSATEIAERYRVPIQTVTLAMRRHERKLGGEQRDLRASRPQRLELNECSDLLREWGVA
jgi:transposase